MLKNYITVTLRAFRKHSLYSFLNVFGLALGLTVVLLIGLYTRFELSYDRFHDKSDRIYRVVQRQHNNFYLGSNEFAVTPAPLEAALRDELAYVESATQINDIHAMVGSEGSGFFSDGLYATPTFFDVFDFPLLRGDPSTALAEPNSVVITPELAVQLFGTEDAVGRSFEITHYQDVFTAEVTGLIEAPPANSHVEYAFVLTYSGVERHANGNWGNNSYYTYAALRRGSDEARFEEDVQGIVDRNMAELSWVKDEGAKIPAFYAQPLTDIHLRSHINFEMTENGDIRYVWLLVLIAGIIMLTACINYMNLATARATTRSREVGVRKVAGADRGQLVRQFLGESVLTALLAAVFAVVLTFLLLPAFSDLIEREIPRVFLKTFWFVGLVAGVGLIVGVISGSYPALLLSRMAPARVLKSGSPTRSARSRLRNTLVVVQFAIGVVLVVGTMVVRQQLEYIRRADTGIDRDHVVAITIRDRSLSENFGALRNELSSVPGVLSVTSTNHMPTSVNSSNGIDEWDGHEEGEELSIYVTSANYGYSEMLGLELVEGRFFSEDHAADEGNALIINETAKRQLGWDSAIGKHLDLSSNGTEVVGVIKDFQFHSAHLEIMPLALYLDTDQVGRMLVKVRPDNIPQTLDGLEQVVARFLPAYPFEYQFLDDAYNGMYRAEQRLGVVFSVVTGLALIIACLGLFGLAAFMTLQRTKEIGVRKALGADLRDIVVLLSRDFGRLVFIAFVVGSPIAYFVMREWLGRFAFRVEIGATVFLAAGLLTALVALLTVGYHSVKASLTDPVKALRYE